MEGVVGAGASEGAILVERRLTWRGQGQKSGQEHVAQSIV